MAFRRFPHTALLLVMLCAAYEAAAQSGTSAIAGIVRDSTGASIPAARVTVVNEHTGVSFNILTNDEGLYRVGSLVPGTYRVEIEADGFRSSVQQQVALAVDQTI
jgi:Carboxypeptidase regulatory-like domain